MGGGGGAFDKFSKLVYVSDDQFSLFLLQELAAAGAGGVDALLPPPLLPRPPPAAIGAGCVANAVEIEEPNGGLF